MNSQFKDMRIDKNLQPLKQSFSRAMTTSRERISNVFDTMWQEFDKLQPDEGIATATSPDTASVQSFEPSLYTLRAKQPTAEDKGIRNSISTRRLRRNSSRSDPDLDLEPEDDMHDAIVPPASQKSPRVITANPVRPFEGGSNSEAVTPRRNSTIDSPVSSLNSTLGPATAATAALGQKAAGMFSNVSSFFQAKKKEILDAQREAEEQYQQRIQEHERKKRLMQERARATASTFAISPKQTLKLGSANASASASASASVSASPSANVSASSSPGPDTRTTGRVSISTSSSPNIGLYTYIAPKSPPTRSPVSSRQSSSPPVAASTPTIAAVAAQLVPKEPETSGPLSTSSPPEIVSPIPTAPVVLSPTLTRGGSRGSSGDGDGEQTPLHIGDRVLDQESQQEIEKELLEALQSSNELSKPSRSSSSSGLAVVPPSSIIAPPRQLTPGESYSPFSEISAPSSPVKSEAEEKGEAATTATTATATAETESKTGTQMAKAADTSSVDESSPIPSEATSNITEKKTEEKEEEKKESQSQIEEVR